MTEPQTIEAVYENGVLRPLQALVGLAERSKVTITIEYQEMPTIHCCSLLAFLVTKKQQSYSL